MSATDSPLSRPYERLAQPVDADRGLRGHLHAARGLTIVQVALPTIQRHLGAHSPTCNGSSTRTRSAWLRHPHLGSISDRFGRKHVFIAGLAVSRRPHCSAVSPNRSPCSSGRAPFKASRRSDVRDRSRPHRPGFPGSGAWQGDRGVGATVGGAVAIGPLVGGLLTSGIGWRWIFHRQRAYWRRGDLALLDKDAQPEGPGATRLDGFGLVSFSAGMFLLELGLIPGNSLGWSSGPIVAMFCGSVSAFVAFVFIELHQNRPMFDLSLFRKPSFSGVSLGTFAVGGGMFALMPYLTCICRTTSVTLRSAAGCASCR